MLQTRFSDLARQPLGHLDGFHHAAAFRHRAGDIGAGRDVAALLQGFDVQQDSHFVHFTGSPLSVRARLRVCVMEASSFATIINFSMIA